MTYATLNVAGAPADNRSTAAGAMPDRRMFHSRLIAALFLAGFLCYGTGSALVASIVGAPDFLHTIASHQTTLVLGAVLMLLPIVTDLWRAVVYFPVLGQAGRSAALTYFGAQIVSVVMFFVGVVSLLLIVPLSQHAVDANGTSVDWANALGALLVQSNGYAYQIAQLALAFGSFALWLHGLRVRLIPRVLSVWGLAGYVLLATGCVAELFGVHIGMLLLIPGALFELAVPAWLLVRGFDPQAYGKA